VPGTQKKKISAGVSIRCFVLVKQSKLSAWHVSVFVLLY
jgi:hypothetical protein